MARLPRLKVENEIGWYHLCARVAGWLNWFPFEDGIARQKLLETIRKYLAVYCCDAAAFCLMGNHYHLVVRFLPFRILPPGENASSRSFWAERRRFWRPYSMSN